MGESVLLCDPHKSNAVPLMGKEVSAAVLQAKMDYLVCCLLQDGPRQAERLEDQMKDEVEEYSTCSNPFPRNNQRGN